MYHPQQLCRKRSCHRALLAHPELCLHPRTWTLPCNLALLVSLLCHARTLTVHWLFYIVSSAFKHQFIDHPPHGEKLEQGLSICKGTILLTTSQHGLISTFPKTSSIISQKCCILSFIVLFEENPRHHIILSITLACEIFFITFILTCL